MKKILVAVSMLVMGLAQAGEIQIFNKSLWEVGMNDVTQEFAVNKEMGRAWVEVKITGNDGSEIPSMERIKVAGLAYDAESKSIVLTHEGQLVTCGTFVTRGRSIFRYTDLKMSGRCKFKSRIVKYTYDDGFGMRKAERYQIVLIVE